MAFASADELLGPLLEVAAHMSLLRRIWIPVLVEMRIGDGDVPLLGHGACTFGEIHIVGPNPNKAREGWGALAASIMTPSKRCLRHLIFFPDTGSICLLQLATLLGFGVWGFRQKPQFFYNKFTWHRALGKLGHKN